MTLPPFIRPEDVPPDQARRILAFLNSVATPEAIDQAVEIPHERDVGVRIGRRILDRRRELGLFTSLLQIDAIPYIGPERFHEIVVTLRDRVEPAPPPPSDLVSDVADLRARVTALVPAQRLTLRAVTTGAYLGQPSTLEANALDPMKGVPLAGRPLTFLASWGRLRSPNGLDFPQGSTLTVPTDVNGNARVVLLPPTSEDLFDDQQDAMVSMLRLLDPAALTPAQAQVGLQEMARQYSWQAAGAFRRAVDVYLRDLRPHLLDTVNLRDYTLAWGVIESTIIVHTPDEIGDGGALAGSAMLRLRFKDWLGAWLEALLVYADEQAGDLRTDLGKLVDRSDVDADRVVEDVQTRVQRYVTRQRGVVGTYVARRVSESSLRSVVDRTQARVEDVAFERRTAVLPALDVASKTVATSAGGAQILAAVTRTRQDAKRTTDTSASKLTTMIAAVQTDVAGRLQTSEFRGFQESVQATLKDKADVNVLNETRTSLQKAVDDTRTSLQQAVDEKVDANTFTDFRKRVDDWMAQPLEMSASQDTTEGLQAQIDRLQTQIDELRKKLG